LLLVAAFWLASPWLAWLAALVVAPGLLLGLGGRPLLRACLPGYLVLWLLLPLPLKLDARLIVHLQGIAARWSSHCLHELRVVHVLDGNVIEVAGQRVLVEEACSGIQSFLIVLATALCFCLWRSRPVGHTVLLVAGGAGLAILANTVRLTSGIAALVWFDFDLLSGWAHEALGLVLFGGCLLLLISLDRLVLFFWETWITPAERREWLTINWFGPARFIPAKTMPAAGLGMTPCPSGPQPSWLAQARWPLAYGAVGVLYFLGMIGFFLQPAPMVDVPFSAPRLTMPGKLATWTVSDPAPKGERSHGAKASQFWQCRSGPLHAVAAIDYPFTGWHDLTVCYKANGWTIRKRQRRQESFVGVPRVPLVEVRLDREPVEADGLLYFALLDEQGNWLTDPDLLSSEGLRAHLSARLLGPLALPQKSNVYQVQVFLSNPEALSPADERATLQLFLEFQQVMRQQLLSIRREQP
jgi:exosortase